eukprot:TRINITY_DN69599_c0_g1_i1.p1 TRINITY_DN69599_c0_g1~~TRINITY_DN69599_c0_g1_i1.p1  ORF type:complete len:455 (+),score=54.10 TRINITY_DN69599_c0_g1_i1:61-1365(+)
MSAVLVSSYEAGTVESLRRRTSLGLGDLTREACKQLELCRFHEPVSFLSSADAEAWTERDGPRSSASSTCSGLTASLVGSFDATDIDEKLHFERDPYQMMDATHDAIGKGTHAVSSSLQDVAAESAAKDAGISELSGSPVGFDFRNCWLVVLVVVSGMSCQAPFEVMHSSAKGCDPLISLTDHVVVMLGSIQVVTQSRCLPWSLHFGLAASSVGYTLLMSAAFSTSLPVGVLVILRNADLATNMFVGACLLGRRYSAKQCVGVALVSAGLVITTVVGGTHSRSASGDIWSALLGVACVVGALFSRALGNVLQEKCCASYGAAVSELLFYRFALGLPMVLLQWESITVHAVRFSTDGTWKLLALNAVFSLATKVCVTKLIGRSSALTATLVLTCQRFLSFVLSATVLTPDQTEWQLWLAMVVVSIGTILYTTSTS